MQDYFIYQDYQIVIERKSIRHAYMRIKPDGSVLMTVNKHLKSEQIQDILDKGFAKLKPKIDKIKAQHQLNILEKNVAYYMGNKYQIVVNYNTQKKEIFLLNNQLHINLTDKNFKAVDPCMHNGDNALENNIELTSDELIVILNNWYKKEAVKVFESRFNAWNIKISDWGVLNPSLTIRAMKSRFGSYNKSKHKVTLSLWLIKAPIELLDYVIAHELAHIKHFNHSKHFYDELARLYPSWHQARKELNHIARIYCNESTFI